MNRALLAVCLQALALYLVVLGLLHFASSPAYSSSDWLTEADFKRVLVLVAVELVAGAALLWKAWALAGLLLPERIEGGGTVSAALVLAGAIMFVTGSARLVSLIAYPDPVLPWTSEEGSQGSSNLAFAVVTCAVAALAMAVPRMLARLRDRRRADRGGS